ncbi:ABC-2 type transporter [Candidatus Magnetoovum chiemensis]|nr:ABC-2 type transporter [Candidatus Magnetoovum chiemensis]
MFNGFISVLYRDITIFRKKARKLILSSSLSPFLFLIAFGWGLGKGLEVNGMPYISFLIPGLITMSSLNQSFGINGEINISRFYFHTFDEYLIAPVSYSQIVLGEIFYGIFKGLISVVIVFVYTLIFGVKLKISVIFFLAIFVHTFLFAALGVTMAMLVKDHASQQSLNNFVITPMIFLCGTFFPVDKLPKFFELLVSILPLTYSIKVMRASLTGGDVNVLHLFIMLAFAFVFYYTALLTIKRIEG